jgi:hypothetical protein
MWHGAKEAFAYLWDLYAAHKFPQNLKDHWMQIWKFDWPDDPLRRWLEQFCQHTKGAACLLYSLMGNDWGLSDRACRQGDLIGLRFHARHIVARPCEVTAAILRYLLAVCAHSGHWACWYWLITHTPDSQANSACWEAEREAGQAGHASFLRALGSWRQETGRSAVLTGWSVIGEQGVSQSITSSTPYLTMSVEIKPLPFREEEPPSLDILLRGLEYFTGRKPANQGLSYVVGLLKRTIKRQDLPRLRQLWSQYQHLFTEENWLSSLSGGTDQFS